MTQNQTFKRVAIIGRQRQPGVQETLVSLYEYLKTRGYTVVFEQQTALVLDPALELTTVPSEHLADACEILLVVGGDGSLLHAAHIAVAQNLPVIGVNRGRLGFLTDIYPHEFTKIEQALNGHYLEEERFFLGAQVWQKKHITAEVEALNEIVLAPGNVAHMVELDVLINEQPMCELRADGLIIATPTGSTAYALSGGGPIMHPSLNALVLVPMFPHTLSNRPIVLDADSLIAINIPEHNRVTPYVSGDGQGRIAVPVGSTLVIGKKTQALRLIHPLDYNYFETLRSKLGWQHCNTAFTHKSFT